MMSQPDTQTEKQVGKFEVNVSGEEQSTPPISPHISPPYRDTGTHFSCPVIHVPDIFLPDRQSTLSNLNHYPELHFRAE